MSTWTSVVTLWMGTRIMNFKTQSVKETKIHLPHLAGKGQLIYTTRMCQGKWVSTELAVVFLTG